MSKKVMLSIKLDKEVREAFHLAAKRLKGQNGSDVLRAEIQRIINQDKACQISLDPKQQEKRRKEKEFSDKYFKR